MAATVARFDAADSTGRLAIIRELGASGDDVSLLALSPRDLSARECNALEGAWRAPPTSDSLDRIGGALRGASPRACITLLGVLARYRAVRCSDAVAGLVAHRRATVRSAAVSTLGRLGDPRSAATLLRLVEKGGSAARDAARALRHVRDPKALEVLSHAYDDCGREARLAIMIALAHAPSLTGTLVAAAEEASTERDSQIRAAAKYAVLRARQ